MSRSTALERTQMCLSKGLPFEFFLPIQTNMYLLVPTLSHISFHPLPLCVYINQQCSTTLVSLQLVLSLITYVFLDLLWIMFFVTAM